MKRRLFQGVTGYDQSVTSYHSSNVHILKIVSSCNQLPKKDNYGGYECVILMVSTAIMYEKQNEPVFDNHICVTDYHYVEREKSVFMAFLKGLMHSGLRSLYIKIYKIFWASKVIYLSCNDILILIKYLILLFIIFIMDQYLIIHFFIFLFYENLCLHQNNIKQKTSSSQTALE